jgi:hypothetical protein
MRLVTVVPNSFKFSLLPTDSVILDHVVVKHDITIEYWIKTLITQ